MKSRFTVVTHPLVAANLSVLRAQSTQPNEFRAALRDLSAMLFYEASRSWETRPVVVETPLRKCAGTVLARPVILVPILRAGLGMLEPMLALCPQASAGHIGLYRDHETLRPVNYYCRLPATLAEAEVLLLDPMLATGHSACEAIAQLKTNGAQRIGFLCVVACPEGIEQLAVAHPDVTIITATVDEGLDARGYILPGLGDAGDRYFGTG